ncbi:dTDP-4-dehydrorhamnose reductase [Vibrio palustris]|uniref:dTDP-4-dehydrorhamnose reductase n=1 Tax=Vibrio palustris TaxID=1918946 RepID=A0A1R4B3Q1_9VIBR|nr:dTDP-4-dehydrorhamnose reductase [Vibrio palustris]SJL83542.1 dTDP-4-dehydrorhamnose reductase [Vibrio palustris]
MRVLVTGSQGQVGQCLVKNLLAKNITTRALDRTQLDITSPQAITQVMDEFKPNIVINAAAYTAVDKAETDSELAYLINRDGAKYLAQAASEVGAALLHISTDYVFSGARNGEYQETDIPAPQGVYGASKLAGELAIQESCARHIILRTAWVFGEYGNNFVKTMLRLGVERSALNIVADQWGGPTYAGDIASALINIAESINTNESVEFGIYHFSGLPYVSWFDFASHIFDAAVDQNVLAQRPELTAITSEMYPTPAIRPANSKLSVQKIKKHFDIDASNWQQALNYLNKYCH